MTYNQACFPALLSTVSSLLTRPFPSPSSPSSSEAATSIRPLASPLILLSFKERDPTGAERDLWTMARQAGIRLEKIKSDVGGHGGVGVEIWVGGLESTF